MVLGFVDASRRFRARCLVGAAIALAAMFAALPSAPAQDYPSRPVKIIVPFPAGGTADVMPRIFAEWLSRKWGQPVIVENRTGAAGMVGANSLFNAAKPDGLTIGFMVGITTQGLIGGESIKFDPAKFRWLGALPQTQVLLARNDLKLATPRDLLKPARPLVLANTGSTSTTGMGNRLFLNMIGATYQHVTGFPGQAESILALARGEVSLDNGGLIAYLARREAIRQEGLYDAILQRGELNPDGTFRRNRLIPEIPTMPEAITELNPAALNSTDFAAYRSIVGAFAVQFGLVLPPGAADATVRMLSKAVGEGLNDPQLRQEVQDKLKTDYDFADGPTAERLVARLRSEFDADPRIGALINHLMTSR